MNLNIVSISVFFSLLLLAFGSPANEIESQLEKAQTKGDSAAIIFHYMDDIRNVDELPVVINNLQKIEYALISIDNDSLTAFLYEKFGAVYKQMGELDIAHDYYDKALSIYNQLENQKAIAHVIYMKSMIYIITFDFDKSMDLCLQSLKIYDELNDKSGQAKVYVQIGITYDYQEQYEEALKYYHKSLGLYQELENKKGISNAYNNIGIIHDLLGETTKALDYYTKSLRIDQERGDMSGVAGSKVNIGLVYYAMDELKKSEKNYTDALQIYTDLNDSYGIGVCHINLASLYREMNRFDDALESINKSANTAIRVNDMKQTIDSYEEMVLIYRAMGDFEHASLTQSTLMALKDSLFSARKKSEIVALQQKYESQKKEKEINELSKQNALHQLAIAEKTNQQIILFGSLGVMVLVAMFFFYQQMRSQKVNEQLSNFNTELERINNKVQTKNLEITDSIEYAKRIQEALLLEPQHFDLSLPNAFVFYRPKDIVSGDFYWCEHVDNQIVFAAVDCTGHGVPGAFMSIVGFNGLNKAVQDTQALNAGEILNQLNKNVFGALHQQNQHKQIKDGMDAALCVYDVGTKKLHFSGARNSLYIVRNEELIEVKGNKKSIAEEHQFLFSNHALELQSGDTIYVFTDGFSDQFGGIGGRKLNYPRFRELLIETARLPVDEQSTHLAQSFDAWRGSEEQVDDVCVIGMKVE